MAIEGLCGWHSNHNADVPWVKSVSTTKVYTQDQALQAVRMAGLLAVTFNSVATEVRPIQSCARFDDWMSWDPVISLY